MKYIIFDLEWNQAADATSMIQEPVYLTGEIVEIGAVKLDENFCPMDELRLYIAPQYYTKMHKQIAALTGIKDRDLAEKGISFPEAYKRFVEWCGDEYAFMTWSMNDMPMLIDNMVLHGIDVSDLPACYDIQRIFSREIMRGETRYSLDTALTLMKEITATCFGSENLYRIISQFHRKINFMLTLTDLFKKKPEFSFQRQIINIKNCKS